MKIAVCLDKNGGMMFNNRRQTRDRAVYERICSISSGRKVYINSYSEKLFDGIDASISVNEDFLSRANNGDICFVENQSLMHLEKDIEEIIIYRWERAYPADTYFDIPIQNKWKLISSYEFSGNSHEIITEEIYSKC